MTADIRSLSNLEGYCVPYRGQPMLHEELAWYATQDNQVFGVLIRDRIDHDFSWVVLAEDELGIWRAIDLDSSCPTASIAMAQLHAAMKGWSTRPETDLREALR